MRSLLLCALILPACSYPEFGFAGDAAAVDSAEPLDADDSAAPPEDADGDSFAPDTFVADTFAPDTASSDTATTDTFVADTFVGDTAADTKPDVPLSTGCTGSTATFCADWDKSTKPEDGFTYPAINTTGSLSLDPSGRSLPNALLATTTPSATDSVVVANLSKIFMAASPTTTMRLDAWMKLETAIPSAGSTFLLKIQRVGGTGDGVTFSIRAPSEVYVNRIGVSYEDYVLTTSPKIGVWTHVRIDARLHPTDGLLTVWVDDMTTPVLSRSAVSTAKAEASELQAIVGLYADKTNAPVRVRYDDVSVTFP